MKRSDFLKTLGLGALGSMLTTGVLDARNPKPVASARAAGAMSMEPGPSPSTRPARPLRL